MLRHSKEGFIQGTTAMGVCSRRERSGWNPNTCRVSRDLNQAEGLGLVGRKLLKHQEKGGILTWQVLTLNKMSARYLSSKMGLFGNNKRIAIWNMQPWRATCESTKTKERKLLSKGRGSWWGWGGSNKQRVLHAMLCDRRRAWGLPLQALPMYFKWGFCLLIFSYRITTEGRPGWSDSNGEEWRI